MEKIIFATGNEHKMIEIRAILSDLGAEILSQKEAGIKADVVEDGENCGTPHIRSPPCSDLISIPKIRSEES